MLCTKDKTLREHDNSIVYKVKCPDCAETYIGETARRLSVRVKEHGKDITSHVRRHTLHTGHQTVDQRDFKVIIRNNSNDNFRRKILEALIIKDQKPSLNKQECSISLKLL